LHGRRALLLRWTRPRDPRKGAAGHPRFAGRPRRWPAVQRSQTALLAYRRKPQPALGRTQRCGTGRDLEGHDRTATADVVSLDSRRPAPVCRVHRRAGKGRRRCSGRPAARRTPAPSLGRLVTGVTAPFFARSLSIAKYSERFVTMQNSTIRTAIGTGLILLIPLFLWLLAIWHWRPGAVVLTFVLLFGAAGLAYQLVVAKKLSNKAYRFAVGLALAAVLLLVWMNAAVGGILGDDPANMMYFGVLLVGFIGAIVARLEPQGMSRALFAMAFAMALVPAIALIIGTPAFANGMVAVFGLHAFYAMLFVGSALLFRLASCEHGTLDLKPTAEWRIVLFFGIKPLRGIKTMRTRMLFATLLTLALCTAGYAQTLDKAKLDQFFDRLAEKKRAMGSLTIAKDG